jgi:hypothetical protein
VSDIRPPLRRRAVARADTIARAGACLLRLYLSPDPGGYQLAWPTARQSQDRTLDEAVRVPEARAPNETPPQYPGGAKVIRHRDVGGPVPVCRCALDVPPLSAIAARLDLSEKTVLAIRVRLV